MPKGQLDVVFGIAGRYGAGVDIHLHDPGELGALQIRMIAERTRALGTARARSRSATRSASAWWTRPSWARLVDLLAWTTASPS